MSVINIDLNNESRNIKEILEFFPIEIRNKILNI